MNDNDIADIIAKANPVPDVANLELSPLSPAETELCEAIMSLPTLIPTDQALPAESPGTTEARRRRRWALAGGASVAAALAALLVVTLPADERSNTAFADWTPVPQAVSATEQSAIESACAVSDPKFGVPFADGPLIDRRGAIAALTAVDGDTRLTCAAQLVDGTWYAFGTTADIGGDLAEPGLMRGWNSGGAEINVVEGFAPGATTVEVDAPEVPTSTATVVDGRYIVWLPQSFDWTESVAGIQIRYFDESGETLQTIDL